MKDEDIAFVCFTDAAVGNRPDMSSTGGHLVGMAHSDFLSGKKGIIILFSWRSGKLQRIARSSLSAEIQSLGEGEQELMYVRAEWSELLGHPLNLRNPSESTSRIPGALVIDAKSVFDSFHKGLGASAAFSLKEKYAALELMAITENLRRQNTPLLWVSSDVQLADGLTKASAADALHFLQRGQLWMIKYDPEFIAAKRKKAVSFPNDLQEMPDDLKDQTWQQLIARHDSTTFSEDFLGMSVIQHQHIMFASSGETCQCSSCGFLTQGTPSALYPL